MRRKNIGQNRVFIVVGECSENLFGRPEKKVGKTFNFFFENTHPPPPPREIPTFAPEGQKSPYVLIRRDSDDN